MVVSGDLDDVLPLGDVPPPGLHAAGGADGAAFLDPNAVVRAGGDQTGLGFRFGGGSLGFGGFGLVDDGRFRFRGLGLVDDSPFRFRRFRLIRDNGFRGFGHSLGFGRRGSVRGNSFRGFRRLGNGSGGFGVFRFRLGLRRRGDLCFCRFRGRFRFRGGFHRCFCGDSVIRDSGFRGFGHGFRFRGDGAFGENGLGDCPSFRGKGVLRDGKHHRFGGFRRCQFAGINDHNAGHDQVDPGARNEHQRQNQQDQQYSTQKFFHAYSSFM